MPAAAPLEIRVISPAATYPLRHAVLWPDKPLEFVKVDDDEQGHHFGAFRAGELVAVISLFVTGPEARFRKFATRPDCQRQGIGTQLMERVLAEARHLGARTLWCDARPDASALYQRFGMALEGPMFYKNAVLYQRMGRSL